MKKKAERPDLGRPCFVLSLLHLRDEMKGVMALAENVLESCVSLVETGDIQLEIMYPTDLSSHGGIRSLVDKADGLDHAYVDQVGAPNGKIRRLASSWFRTWKVCRRLGSPVVVWVDYSAPTFLSRKVKLLVHFTDLKFLVRDRAAWTSPEFIIRKLLIPRLARRADAVLPISDRSTLEFRDYFPLSGFVETWPLFCRIAMRPGEATRGARGASPPLTILMVGTINQHKRYDVAIRSMAAAGVSSLELRIAGLPTANSSTLENLACELGVGSRVHLVGSITDEQLLAEYRNADVFLQCSDYEGFGLGVLEAMRSGLPAVLSDIPAHREVAGPSASYFAPGDVDALATLIGGLQDLGAAEELPLPVTRTPADAARELLAIANRPGLGES